jgi:hypothetical protein
MSFHGDLLRRVVNSSLRHVFTGITALPPISSRRGISCKGAGNVC